MQFIKFSRNLFHLIVLIVVAYSGMGSSCISSSAPVLFFSASSPGYQNKLKYWKSPVMINANLNNPSDGSSYSHANRSTGNLYFPMSVYSDGIRSFNTIFSIRNTTINDVQLFGTYPLNFYTDQWAVNETDYYRIDRLDEASFESNVGDSKRVRTAVDPSGNAISIFSSINSSGLQRLIATRKESGAKSWIQPRDITDTDVTGTYGILLRSFETAADYLGNTMVVWCQNNGAGATDYTPHYNRYEYNPDAWRFPLSDGVTTTNEIESGLLCNDSGVSTTGLGVDFSFQPNSKTGALVLSSSTQSIKVKRYNGSTNLFSSTAAETLVGASSDTFPRIFIDSKDRYNVFFYRNTSFVTNTAELYFSQGSYSSTFSTPTRFDSSSGTGSVLYYYSAGDTEPLPPVLAHNGDYAAVGFIKSDGIARRFYVSIYNHENGSWTTPVPITDSGNSNDVTWADLAINSGGDVLATFSQVSTDNLEHVFGRIYTANEWQTTKRLDISSGVQAAAAPAFTRPSGSIDNESYGVVTFSSSDGSNRKAFATFYR